MEGVVCRVRPPSRWGSAIRREHKHGSERGCGVNCAPSGRNASHSINVVPAPTLVLGSASTPGLAPPSSMSSLDTMHSTHPNIVHMLMILDKYIYLVSLDLPLKRDEILNSNQLDGLEYVEHVPLSN